MRLFAVGVLGALVVAGGAAAEAPPSSGSRNVPCSEVIGQARFPYVGNRLPQYRYRTFLSATSVPPGYMRAYENRDPAWPWWTKYGVVVRAGGPRVTLSVPPAWRDRVGISWGNAGHGVLASVTLTSCGGPSSIGHAYAGGFFIRRTGECFPLDLRAGTQKTRVWFGLGKRCPTTTG
jgi:hypothetical protein